MKAGAGFEASEAQRRKVAGQACVVCWKAPCDPAHLIPRSLAPDPNGEALRVVPLCRNHHRLYDEAKLDLLPYLLLDRYGREVGYAVERVGLVVALERISNQKWRPE